MKKTFLLIGVLMVALAPIGFYLFDMQRNEANVPNVETAKIQEINNERQPVPEQNSAQAITSTEPEIIASGLQIPWDLAFMPDGDILVTERPGRVVLVSAQDRSQTEIAKLNQVKHIGEGGLLGIALSPQFQDNNFVYLYYTNSSSGNTNYNKVSKFKFENNKLTNETVIVDKIPGASTHDGGQIEFSKDGYLYITTGDAQEPSKAQDKNSLAGKILKVNEHGNAAPGNPYNNRVYSLGHRNPQGLVWDDSGELWAVEHGPSMHDELNKIERGKNYGWPDITGTQTKDGMVVSVVESGEDTWAPSGIEFKNGKIYFAGLRGNALFEYDISKPQSEAKLVKHFEKEFGRLRGLKAGPDGALYFTTSNRDGRGSSNEGDDKIFKVNL